MSAYYNENDPKAAAWLRELISAGLIADGDVDERSICDVQSTDLMGYTQCHFFAGIGGWSHALRLAEWPDSKRVWTGSCPCQPFSNAGKGAGTADKRHLWPDFYRLISECKPSTVFGEQVASPLGRGWLDGVFDDLESSDYSCGAFDIPACSVGAPHIRQRLYWVADTYGAQLRRESPEHRESPHAQNAGVGERMAYPESDRFSRAAAAAESPGRAIAESGGRMADAASDNEWRVRESKKGDGFGELPTGRHGPNSDFWHDWRFVHCSDGKKRRIKSDVEPLVDGLSGRVAALKGVGNAIVPPLAAEFIKAFAEVGVAP